MKEFLIGLAAAAVILGSTMVSVASHPWLAVGAMFGTLAKDWTGAPAVQQTRTSTLPGYAVNVVPPDQWDVMARTAEIVSCHPRPEDVAAVAQIESKFGANMASVTDGQGHVHSGYAQGDAAWNTAFLQGGNPFDFHDAIPAIGRSLCAKGYGANRAQGLNNYGGCVTNPCLHLPGFDGTYAGLVDTLVQTFLPSVPALQSQNDVIRIAQRWVDAHVPYLFGGCSMRGVDCSCFTQLVYQSLGRSLPRTAAEQYAATQRVPNDQLQVGDLVFFANTYMPGISHVGIYAGGGMQWNAPTDGQVVSLQPVFTGYWGAHFAGAGRVRG